MGLISDSLLSDVFCRCVSGDIRKWCNFSKSFPNVTRPTSPTEHMTSSESGEADIRPIQPCNTNSCHNRGGAIKFWVVQLMMGVGGVSLWVFTRAKTWTSYINWLSANNIPAFHTHDFLLPSKTQHILGKSANFGVCPLEGGCPLPGKRVMRGFHCNQDIDWQNLIFEFYIHKSTKVTPHLVQDSYSCTHAR